jgi:hypothetical protein
MIDGAIDCDPATGTRFREASDDGFEKIMTNE